MKVTKGLRQGTDERQSAWVVLHDGNEYLLPIVARKQRFVPRFTSAGVLLDQQEEDPELARLLDSFIELATTVDSGAIWINTEQTLQDFFALMGYLLRANYEYTDDELTALLSVTTKQLTELFETIFTLVAKR